MCPEGQEVTSHTPQKTTKTTKKQQNTTKTTKNKKKHPKKKQKKTFFKLIVIISISNPVSMSGKNLYKRNEKIQMLREQFMLSKKMYYSYLLNFIDEYWRNIYLKFREKIRKTSMLVMTINNVLYKAHIKANRTIQTERITQTEHITHTTRTSRPSSDTRLPIHTQDQLETNKGNKCIPYDNLRHLIFRMKVVKIKDKKAIKINKNKVKNCINLIKGMIALRKDKAKKHKAKKP